jgi:phospholipase C
MPFDLSQIETIVIVLMENRSFDHMLGHLSLPDHGNRSDVDGAQYDPAWIEEFTNDCSGAAASGRSI